MSRRLKYMTPIHCPCGARGDLVWSEAGTTQSCESDDYQIESVTELFALQDDVIVCRLCDRALPSVGSSQSSQRAKAS